MTRVGDRTRRRLAERLRKHVAMDAVSGLPVNDRVTVSIGLATWEGPEDSLENLLARADQALYRAKRKGRGRIEITFEHAAA